MKLRLFHYKVHFLLLLYVLKDIKNFLKSQNPKAFQNFLSKVILTAFSLVVTIITVAYAFFTPANHFIHLLIACVCVFISFQCIGFSWPNIINTMSEFRSAMVCWGNFSVSNNFVATSKTIIIYKEPSSWKLCKSVN